MDKHPALSYNLFMKTTRFLTLAILLVLIGCSGSDTEQTQSKPRATLEEVPSEASQPARQQGELFQLSDGTPARLYGEADVKEKDRITIEIGSSSDGVYYFTPTVLFGRPGQSIALEVFNRDSQGHPFEVRGQGG
ncbi:MAG: hypothetical protein ACRD1T_27220, partial [Acidimicrobiia bacterium]